MLQHVQERLAAVALRVEAGAVQHFLHLAAERGNAARAHAVGGGGEQPDEDLLAGHLAVRVELLHGDDVERHRPVHG